MTMAWLHTTPDNAALCVTLPCCAPEDDQDLLRMCLSKAALRKATAAAAAAAAAAASATAAAQALQGMLSIGEQADLLHCLHPCIWHPDL
jgi:hypothetical protein